MLSAPASDRRGWVDDTRSGLSISRQCELLDVSRSSVNYTPNTSETLENLAPMGLIDEEYTRHPFFGVSNISDLLSEQDYNENHNRVARVMGVHATVLGTHTSLPHPRHQSSNPRFSTPKSSICH